MRRVLREFCAENNTHIEAAIRAGAQRIELCDNLAVGGTTASYGVMQATIALAHAHQVAVMVLIRPRGGHFVYTETEVTTMLTDIQCARQLGADGVVIGALTPQGTVDKDVMRRLLAQAAGMDCTFHMAFDALAVSEQLATIDWLAANGVRRILTHGGPANQPIEAHLPWLRQLIAQAAGRLTVMLGGTVTHQNIVALAQMLDTDEFHGTQIVPL